jgi:hypothetical protein
MSAEPQTLTPQVFTPEVVTTNDMLPLSADKKTIFLNALVQSGGNVTRASALVGTSRQNVMRWLSSDPAFAELYNDALEAGTENLEERCYVRAMDTSDRLAEFLLKARRPEKYRENINLNTEVNLSDTDVSRIGESLMSSLMEAARKRKETLALESNNPE